ncbi:MAG: hypothetical protein KDD22_03440, partial [Bdellovibrionales bacterium]|nr:hypothetical protein [Bdellovibrionales bacterium]
ERYESAAKIFDELLVQKPASEFDLIIMYNSAAAYEGMKDCKTAGRRYRQVGAAAAKNFPRIEAQALYRLSYAFECMSRPDKVIATLNDVERRKQYLAPEVAQAEVPARLSSAYAQLGEIDTAQKYFKKAEMGIQQLQRQFRQRTDLDQLLARTYFFMGRVQDRNALPSAESYLKGLRFQQMHLIKAVEMDVQPWADKSAKSILQAYEDLWGYIAESEKQKSGESYQKLRAHVLEWAEGGLQALSELNSLRFPGAQESSTSRRMFSNLSNQESRFQKIVSKYAVSTPLTQEAESRQGIQRKGRVKSNSPSILETQALEQKQKKSSKR